MTVACVGLLFVMWCEEPKTPPPVIVCPAVQEWSPKFQQDVADSVEIYTSSPLIEVTRQHMALRAKLRKCQKRLRGLR